MSATKNTKSYLWDYVNIKDSSGRAVNFGDIDDSIDRKSHRIECKFCFQNLNQARVDRISEHLKSKNPCKGVKKLSGENSAAQQARLDLYHLARDKIHAKSAEKKANNEFELFRVRGQYPEGMNLVAGSPEAAAVENVKARSIEAAFQTQSRAAVDMKVALAFYACGLPFNLAENTFFRDAMDQIGKMGGNYKFPRAQSLSGDLLNNTYDAMKSDMKKERERLITRGVTLVGDGATNVHGDPILNFLAVSGSRVEFLRAINVGGNIKNQAFMTDLWVKIILEQTDPRSVVNICQDNATRYFWKAIETKCPWVVCTPCLPHVLDLLLEDIGKIGLIKDVLDDADLVRVFIRAHGQIKHAYNQLRDSSNTALIKLAQTRFAVACISLINLLKNKECIRGCMVADATEAYIAKNGSTKLINAAFPTMRALFVKVKSLCLTDEFWEDLEMIGTIMRPIMKLLKFAESDAPTLSKMHHAFFTLVQHLDTLANGLPPELHAKIMELVHYRWQYGYSDLQAVGFLLDPAFWKIQETADVVARFHSYIQRIYAHLSEEDGLEKCNTVLSQYHQYKNTEGYFNHPWAIGMRGQISAVEWWEQFGMSHAGELATMAIRVCNCCAGAAAAERGHKDMASIHTKARNRLREETVEKLLYVKINSLNAKLAFVGTTPNAEFDLDDLTAEAEEFARSPWRGGSGDPAPSAPSVSSVRPESLITAWVSDAL